jgi:hypothetical protein
VLEHVARAGNCPAGGSASPAGTNTSSVPIAVSRATISARWAPSRTSLADRCGTTRNPAAVSRSVSASVGSSPFVGDAVTVMTTSCGTASSTASSALGVGSTS